jgi:hypothetical protein
MFLYRVGQVGDDENNYSIDGGHGEHESEGEQPETALLQRLLGGEALQCFWSSFLE